LGYKVYGKHEIGVWGAQQLNMAHCSEADYRGISQASLFYRYPFENGAQVFAWAGVPYGKSLMNGTGRPGAFVVGANVIVPVSGHFSLFANAQYMKPNGSAGDSGNAAEEENAAVTVGLSYGFGGQPNTETRNMPLIPVANNGTFMVDTNY
jgi:hypothetical protein